MYVINEFWIPFISGAAIITGVWLSADQLRRVFRLITGSADAPISLAFTILGLHMPEILVTTIPIGVLWGSFLVFTRLNNDSEIIAMRTSGLSMFRVLRPVIIFGVITATLSFTISEYIVPFTGPLVRKIEIYSLYKSPLPQIKKNFTYLEKGKKRKLKRIFYAEKYNVEKDFLKRIVILDFTKEGLTQIYSAKKAAWSPQKGGWVLREGVSHFLSIDDQVSRVSSFDEFFIPSGTTPAKLIKDIGDPNLTNFAKLWKTLKMQEDTTIHTDEYFEARVQFHRKFARPVACILIALVGAPLGILPRRSSSTWNYVFLAMIIFLFYMTQSICNSLAEAGRMLPFVAAWFSNMVLFGISILIILRRSRMA